MIDRLGQSGRRKCLFCPSYVACSDWQKAWKTCLVWHAHCAVAVAGEELIFAEKSLKKNILGSFFLKFDSLMVLSVAKWTKDMFYLNLHCIGKEDSPVWVVWSKSRWEIKWQELFAGYKYIHVCVSFKISRAQRRQCVLNNELLSAASRQLFQLDQTQSHSSDNQDWDRTSANKKNMLDK